MRNFCIHCGAANAPEAMACAACARLLVASNPPAAPATPTPLYPVGLPHAQRPGAQTPDGYPYAPMAAHRQALSPWSAPALPATYASYGDWAGHAQPRTDGSAALDSLSLAPGLDWDQLPDPEALHGPALLAPYAAGFGLRFVSTVVDLTAGSVALSFIFILLGLLQLATNASNAAIGALALLAVVGWWPLYFISFWARGGRTLGYRVAGLHLVRSDGSAPTLATSMLRFMGLGLSLTPLLFGYLWMIRDPYKQAWHDKVADTMVVKE